MKTLKTILATLFFVALAANSNGQSAAWDPATNGTKLTPTTANAGIGADPSAKAKLLLRKSVSSTDTVFGLYSFMENINTSNKPFYGAYFKNKRSSTAQSSSLLYGIYLDNENTTYGNENYGVYVKNSIGGYSGTSYGFYVDNSTGGNSGTAYGFYANNSGGGTVGSLYGIQLINNKTGSSSGSGDVFGVHSTNTTNVSTKSVYGVYLSSKHTSTSASASVYGIYSTVEGGAPDKRWAGYFTGGNVVVMNGNAGIGTAVPKTKLEVGSALGLAVSASNLDPNQGYDLNFLKNTGHLLLGWNYSGGKGEQNFVSNRAGGSEGGFAFYDYSNNGTMTHLMTLTGAGNIGIGTPNPSQALTVQGRVTVYPQGVTPDNTCHGNLIITKPASSGQYINLIRQSNYAWSIGTVYNSNTFAIGSGKTTDSQFTNPFFTINVSGNVGIGRPDPYYKLDVVGTIRAHEVRINTNTGADFVFDENYTLKTLDEVHSFIKTNRRLPEIPAATDMIENGLDIGEFQIKLLQKIEELTLYVIEQNKQLKLQQEEINKLKNR